MPCALMIYKVNFDANSMYKFRVFATFSESLDRIVMHLFHYQALLIFFLRTEISVIVLNFGPRLSRFCQDVAQYIQEASEKTSRERQMHFPFLAATLSALCS